MRVVCTAVAAQGAAYGDSFPARIAARRQVEFPHQLIPSRTHQVADWTTDRWRNESILGSTPTSTGLAPARSYNYALSVLRVKAHAF